MYFRQSRNKIIKLRPLLGQSFRWGCYRNLHTRYMRPFSVQKCDEITNVTSSVLCSSRHFCNQIFNNGSKENEKFEQKPRSAGIDLLAPSFRSDYHLLKSTIKNRKEIGGKFHTMPQKSLTLKLCRQPSKYLSTSRISFKDAWQSKEEKKDNEAGNVATKSKDEICRDICDRILPAESNVMAKSLSRQPLKRKLDKLTDAEIDEICKKRSPCKELNTREKINSPNGTTTKQSPGIIQSTEKLESSNAAIPSAKALGETNITGGKLEGFSSTFYHRTEKVQPTSLKSSEKLEDEPTTIPSTKTLQHASIVEQPTKRLKISDIQATKKSQDPSTIAKLEKTFEETSKVEQSAKEKEVSSTSVPSIKTLEDSSTSIQRTEVIQGSPKTSESEKKLEDPSTAIQAAEASRDSSTVSATEKTLSTAEQSPKDDSSNLIKTLDDSSTAIQMTKASQATISQPEKTLKDAPTVEKSAKKSEDSLPLTKTLEDPSTAIQTKEGPQDSSIISQLEKTLKDASSVEQFAKKIEGSSTEVPSTEILKDTSISIGLPEKFESKSTTIQSTEIFDSPSTTVPSVEVLRSLPNDSKSPIRTTMPLNDTPATIENAKMKRYRSGKPEFQVQPTILPKMQNLSRNSHQEMPRQMKYRNTPQRVRVEMHPGNRPRQHPYPSPPQYIPPNVRNQFRPSTQLPFGYQPRPENICFPKHLKPESFRFAPIYDKSHYSQPAVYSRLQYIPADRPVRRQRLRTKPLMFGSQNIKNKQTFDLNTNPKELNGKSWNIPPDVVREPNPNDEELKAKNTMAKLVENHAVVIEGPSKLKLITLSGPQLHDEKDVIIQMEYVTLTDADRRHYLTGKYNSYSYATSVVGRTGTGTIIETGPKVRNVKPGDKVLVKQYSCGECSLCLSDRRNICENVTATYNSPMQGVLSRLHVHPSEFVTKIPHNVSLLKGALASTLSIAIRACQKAVVSAGDVIMVIGGGPLGTATALAAQQMGATTVCLSDTRQPVLEEAHKLGIEKTFLIDLKSPSKNTAIKLWEEIGDYPRLTFDCTGWQLSNEIAIHATKTGGKVIFMTNSENGAPLLLPNVVAREVDVIVATTGTDESAIAALRFLSTNKVFFSSSMYKHYDLSDVQEAFKHLSGPEWLDAQAIVKFGCKCGSRINLNKESSE